jgi:hypothetical protein
MIELWKSMSDDQIALVGCAAALFITGMMMSLSYYIGRGRIASDGLNLKAGSSSPIPSQLTRPKSAAASANASERREAA